jgi:heme/copper-type cytochrome/quinol oxidase subunit 3
MGKIGSGFSTEASVFLPLYFLLTGFHLLHDRTFRETF